MQISWEIVNEVLLRSSVWKRNCQESLDHYHSATYMYVCMYESVALHWAVVRVTLMHFQKVFWTVHNTCINIVFIHVFWPLYGTSSPAWLTHCFPLPCIVSMLNDSLISLGSLALGETLIGVALWVLPCWFTDTNTIQLPLLFQYEALFF